MTVTLDDVSRLMHLPIDGMLLSHESVPRAEAFQMTMELLGDYKGDTWTEVDKRRDGHARFSYLKRIFKERIEEAHAAYHARNLIESAHYVDVAYLRYFKNLELVSDYAWGVVALAHLYMELNNVFHYKTKHLSGYLSLLQI